jgi:hypothetical protein
MVFLSAQPDEYYFTWQIELQIFNFNKLGILPENIHILIGYDPKKQLSHYFHDLIDKWKHKASFFVYPDERQQKKYPSSIRPNIIRQHFEQVPALQHEIVFYHDSDIVFRELPDFDGMAANNTWYVSDTRRYLDSAYIKRTTREGFLEEMCATVGISPDLVIENDPHCGGAQYLLKDIPISFWSKIEADSEVLYEQMLAHNREQSRIPVSTTEPDQPKNRGIQAWCADMWALFWNALLIERKVEIHPQLNFCWASTPIEDWHQNRILHYTGHITKKEISKFRKGNYLHFPPYYDSDLVHITEDTCSFALSTLIKEFVNEEAKQRIDLMDVTFLITVRIDSDSRLENLSILLQYLKKYFKTNIYILESDAERKIPEILTEECRYALAEDTQLLLYRTRLNNSLIAEASTDIIAIYDTDIILPISQILQSVEKLRERKADMVYPFDGRCTSVDMVFKTMFSRMLDPELFTFNEGKFVTGTSHCYGGAVFINREKYRKAGMDNEYITSWGPEDVERAKRMKNLEYKVERIPGPLFHLPHMRTENSAYADIDTRVGFMEEYLKVCNMDRAELEDYITSWPWARAV